MHEQNCYICEQCNNWYECRKDLEDHKERRHKEFICDQCGNNWYESKEELSDHIRRIHTKYNCDQCDNWYRLKEDLEDHKNEAHSKECEKGLECRIERKQQEKKQQEYESECDLCKEKFKDENEQVNHWKRDHEVHIYECIHLSCRIKYICQDTWKKHMKDKHRISFNCEQCNEYCLFEEQLKEHIEEEHIEDEEHIEPTGFEC